MKSLFTLILVLSASLSYGQLGFRAEIGTGVSFAFKEIQSTGFNFNVEPKILFGDRMAVGMRIESNLLYGGVVDLEPVGEVSVGTTFKNGILAKLDYSLPIGNGYSRMMFGFMGGLYTHRGIGTKGTKDVSLISSRSAGFAPEIGFARGSFKASLIYHVIPGTDTVNFGSALSSIIFTKEVSRNYLVLNLSLNLFSTGEVDH